MIDFLFENSLKGWRYGWPYFLWRTFCFLPLLFIFFSCDSIEARKPIEYHGPIREGENVEMLYAEEDLLKVKIIAKRVKEFQNGDREFPEGVVIEFYENGQKVTSTLSANTAYYFKSSNKWRGQGKVEVRNIGKGEQLNTEELFWFPVTKKISTEKFVTIRTLKEVIYGTGLEANQDMSEYQIKHVEGEFDVEE